MRTKLRSKITLLFVVCAVLIVVPAVAAFADLVKNDVVVNGTDTIAAGGTTTINYRIENNNAGGNDFKECDAADGSPVTVTIVKPAGVTASPGSLQFNLCESPQGVQFSAANAGNYPISVTTSDTRGNYNVGAAAFTLHVTPPPPPLTPRRRLAFRLTRPRKPPPRTVPQSASPPRPTTRKTARSHQPARLPLAAPSPWEARRSAARPRTQAISRLAESSP
jgi:outer membrane autotransporter protein